MGILHPTITSKMEMRQSTLTAQLMETIVTDMGTIEYFSGAGILFEGFWGAVCTGFERC